MSVTCALILALTLTYVEGAVKREADEPASIVKGKLLALFVFHIYSFIDQSIWWFTDLVPGWAGTFKYECDGYVPTGLRKYGAFGVRFR